MDGPLYVIQLHQAEFTTAVAAVGARRMLVVFEGDDGTGIQATGKLIAGFRTALISSGHELAVVDLPNGSDPDGLIRSRGPDALIRPIEQLVGGGGGWGQGGCRGVKLEKETVMHAPPLLSARLAA